MNFKTLLFKPFVAMLAMGLISPVAFAITGSITDPGFTSEETQWNLIFL